MSKSTEDPGWLLAEIDGKQGLIPDNFVEILRPAVPACTVNSETHKVSYNFLEGETGKKNEREE